MADQRKYEEFEPTTEWARDQAFDTLLVYLPGFKKENLKVQVTSGQKLRVTGERQQADKWTRFRLEVPIPSNLDSDKVTARFDNGILYVKFQKVIAPAEPQPKPTTTPQATSEPESQKKDQQQKTDDDDDARKLGKEAVPQRLNEEEKKPKAEKPDKGKKPVTEMADHDDAADFTQTGPSDWKGAPFKEPRSGKGHEGEERTKHKRTWQKDSGYHEESTGGFLERIKQPRNLMNSIVAVLVVLMLAVYLKHSFKSFRGKQSFDLPNP